MALEFPDLVAVVACGVFGAVLAWATPGAEGFREMLGTLTLRRMFYVFLSFIVAAAGIGYWVNWGVREFEPAAFALHVVLLLGSLLGIAYAENIAHEHGHLASGLRYKMPLAQLRLNAPPKEMPLDPPRWEFKIGWAVGRGRVEFYAHPIERTKRIVMYASGIAMSLAVGIVVSALLPADLNWLRVEILLYVVASALGNWALQLRGDRWSDGQAIRGLISQNRSALKRVDFVA